MSNICDRFYQEISALQTQPKHPAFPSLNKPGNLEVFQKGKCEGCPQSAAHVSYRRGRFTSPLPTQYIPSQTLLASAEWFVDRVDKDLGGIYGSQPNFRYNASGGVNMADSLGWKLVSVSGKMMTCVCSPDPSEDPAGRSLFAYRRFPSDPFGIWYLWGRSLGTVQSGDRVRFGTQSLLFGKSQPMVVRVAGIDRSNPARKTITWEVDQDVSKALRNRDTAINSLTLSEVDVATWRYAGQMPQWLDIIPMGYLATSDPVTVVITRAMIPQDGRLLLKDANGQDCRIAYYKPGNADLGQRETIYATARVNGVVSEWTQTVTPRIYVEQTGPASWRTWFCLKGIDWRGQATLSDVTQGLEELRLTYEPQATSGKWKTRCSSRCVHSKCAYSTSDYSAPFGTGVDAKGRLWYCERRRYDVEREVDTDGDLIPDKIEYTEKEASQARGYYPECYRPGTCSDWEPLESGGEGERQFTFTYSLGRYLANLVSAVPMRLEQIQPGVPDPSNYTLYRVKHPSIRSLVGSMIPLNTRYGWHPSVSFPLFGLGVGPWTTATDAQGNTSIVPIGGFNWDSRTDLTKVEFGNTATYPKPGALVQLAGGDGFGQRRNPLAFTSLVGNGEDPTGGLRVHEDGQGLRIRRDTGELEGRVPARYSHLVSAPEEFLAEDLVTVDAFANKWQQCGDLRVKFFDTPATILGKKVKAVIEVLRLTVGGVDLKENPYYLKEEAEVVSGAVSEVIDLGGGRYRLVFENKEQCWSYLVNIGFGESYDEIKTFRCGGNIVLPDDWLKVDDYYQADKTIGDTTARCSPGDAIAFASGDPEFSARRFVVVATKAHDPRYQAPNWGEETVYRSFTPTGFFQPDKTTLRLDLNGDGVIDDKDQNPTIGDPEDSYYAHGIPFASTGVSNSVRSEAPDGFGWINFQTVPPSFKIGCYVKNRRTGEIARVAYVNGLSVTLERPKLGSYSGTIQVGDVWELVLVTDYAETTAWVRKGGDKRPALSSGQFWICPQTGRFFFSQQNLGARLRLWWACDGQPSGPAYCYSKDDYYLCETDSADVFSRYPRWKSGLSWTEYSGMARTVRFGLTGKELSSAGQTRTPAQGSYGLMEESGSMVFYFHADDAGALMSLKVITGRTLAGLSENGDDIAPIHGFGTWGRYKDTVEILDESGYFAQKASALAGCQATVYRSSQVYHPAPFPEVRAASFRQAWSVSVASTEVISEHGRGVISLSETAWNQVRALGDRVCLGVKVQRWDHRARPNMEMLKKVLFAVNRLNKFVTTMTGASESCIVWAHLFHDQVYSWDDYVVPQRGGLILPRRGSLPIRSITERARWMIRARAMGLRWSGRGGFAEWGFGYNGYNMTGIQDSDLMLQGSAPYHLSGACGNGQDIMVYLDDAFAGYSYPDYPVFTEDQRIVAGDVWNQFQEGKSPFDIYNENGELAAPGFSDPYNPASVGWNCGISEGEGVYECFPVTMPSPVLEGGNFVGALTDPTWLPNDPTFVFQMACETKVSATIQPVGFPEWLQNCPDGTKIVKAEMEVLAEGMKRVVFSFEQSYDRNTKSMSGSCTTTETVESVTYMLMGKVPKVGVSELSGEWHALAGGISGVIANGLRQVVDVTQQIQTYLDEYRNKSDYSAFGFMPAPYTGLIGKTDFREMLSSMMPSTNWVVDLDPDYVRPSWADEDVYLPGGALDTFPQDVRYQQSGSLQYVTWGGLSVGKIAIEFTYPDGEYGRRSFGRNLPRFD
jgi:hypothetical protein